MRLSTFLKAAEMIELDEEQFSCFAVCKIESGDICDAYSPCIAFYTDAFDFDRHGEVFANANERVVALCFAHATGGKL